MPSRTSSTRSHRIVGGIAGRIAGRSAGFLRDFAAVAFLAWLATSAATLIAAMSIRRSALHRGSIPSELAWTFMARELLLLAAFVAILVAVPTLTAMAERRHVALRALAPFGHAVAGAGIVFLAGSWITFRSAGVFLDLDGAGFAATNLTAFVRHIAAMEPWVLAIAPPAMLAAAVLLSVGLPRVMAGSAVWLRNLTAAAGVLVLAVVLMRAFGPDSLQKPEDGINDAEVGMVWTRGELVSDTRDRRTGPLQHIVAAWRHRMDDLHPDPRVRPSMPPILPLEDWLASVDPERLQRRSVILLLVESLRPDMLRSGGSERDVMPTVDRLAAGGRVWTNSYAQATHSNYADIAAIGGHYPLRSRGTHVYTPNAPYPRVLPWDLLRPLGWRTAIISSQDERWGGMIHYLTSPGLEHLLHSVNFEGPTYVPYGDRGFEAMVKGSKRSGKIDDRFTVDEAVRWIDSIGDDPFFLYMNLQASHLPYATPTDFPRRFGRDQLPFVIRFNDYPPASAHLVKDQYANALAYVDHHFARLVDHLEKTGRLDETILVITGDTGQAFYEHGFAAHANSLYEEVLRVPLVMRGPGLRPGRDHRPAQHIDMVPTILDLLGLPEHPAYQGVSLVSPAEDPGWVRDRFLVAQCPAAHQVAIERDGFKLIHDLRRNRRWLLDLQLDPEERTDAAERVPEVFGDLSRRLDTWHYWQLRYYRDAGLHGRFYPPRPADSLSFW